jgi:hypothetical protein
MANESQLVLHLVSVKANCAPPVLPTHLRTGHLPDPGGRLTPYSIVHATAYGAGTLRAETWLAPQLHALTHDDPQTVLAALPAVLNASAEAWRAPHE